MSQRNSSVDSFPNNPRQGANILSILFFAYTWNLFKKGIKRELSEQDLYKALKEDSSKSLGDRLEREWNKELLKPEPSLYNAIVKVFCLEFSKYIVMLFLIQTGRLSQPIALYYLLQYFVPGQKEYTKFDAYMCTGFICLASVCFVFMAHTYLLGLQHLGMKIRVACSSLVYRKCLRLSKSELDHLTIGQLVNLLSNDVSRFDNVTLHLPYLFVGILELPALVALMLLYSGLSPLSGITLMLLAIPVIIILADQFAKIRKRQAHKSDVRSRLMNEAISGIQVIKMYAWEDAFKQLINKAREYEVEEILKSARIKAAMMSFSLYLARASIFVTILTEVLLGNTLEATHTFFIVAFFNMLRQSLAVMFPSMVATLAETTVSIRRLQHFLMFKECHKAARYTRSDIGVTLIGASAKWCENEEDTLTLINLTCVPGELLVVIGAVASGKSSLMHVILEELPLSGGILGKNGKVSYASQEPWLFNASIRENIIYDQTYNPERYKRVVEICALKRDFTLLPSGDETEIGEKGVTLSGGQKARVALARAVYKEADIYLLDDPLSAVDSEVGKIIFEKCIRKFLKNKCTILITHQIQYLREVQRIVLLRSGAKVFEGTYWDLYRIENEFTNLLEKETLQRADSVTRIEDEEDSVRLTPQKISKEKRYTGKIKLKVYAGFLKRGGGCWRIGNLVGLLLVSQCFATGSDIFISYWVNKEQDRSLGAKVEPLEYYVIFYSVLVIFLFVFTSLRTFEFFRFCARASRKLHNDMFKSIVHAPMSFFYEQPTGRILNRFTKDIGTLDDAFPIVALETLQVLGIFMVTLYLSIISGIGMCVLVVVFYCMRLVYLRTSRGIKRLEGVSKSPVFNQISTSLNGLTSIRAFRTEEYEIGKFDSLQDVHSSVWYIFLSTARSFSFSLDLTCSLYNIFVFFTLLYFYDVTHGGNMGLLVTQSLMLTGMLQWGMRQWSEMENHMTSVERICEYIKLEQEPTSDRKREATDWPIAGAIDYNNVFVYYKPEEPPVLNAISFHIRPRQKIGVVGRTGAGKSSLIASLFRLVNVTGDITIDGVDTTNVPLHLLRSRIAIIPQEPVLFAGSLRRNLDPFLDYTDHEIWLALREVEMKNAVSDLPEQLHHEISERGANFSVGQRQLLCLARAILKNNIILVMDEATANVDPQTDQLIQKTIRRRFNDCTVITIAHRLNTVLDSDRIIVLENGHLVEYGHPYILLQNDRGLFYKMVQKTGLSTAANFIFQAEQNYARRGTGESKAGPNKTKIYEHDPHNEELDLSDNFETYEDHSTSSSSE